MNFKLQSKSDSNSLSDHVLVFKLRMINFLGSRMLTWSSKAGRRKKRLNFREYLQFQKDQSTISEVCQIMISFVNFNHLSRAGDHQAHDKGKQIRTKGSPKAMVIMDRKGCGMTIMTSDNTVFEMKTVKYILWIYYFMQTSSIELDANCKA
jgi:hypothetical protein